MAGTSRSKRKGPEETENWGNYGSEKCRHKFLGKNPGPDGGTKGKEKTKGKTTKG